MDETTAQVFQRLNDVEQQLRQAIEHIAHLDDEMRQLQLKMRQLERPKLTTAEALQLFEYELRDNPSLNLASFALNHNLNYDTLRQARSRKRRKQT